MRFIVMVLFSILFISNSEIFAKECIREVIIPELSRISLGAGGMNGLDALRMCAANAFVEESGFSPAEASECKGQAIRYESVFNTGPGKCVQSRTDSLYLLGRVFVESRAKPGVLLNRVARVYQKYPGLAKIFGANGDGLSEWAEKKLFLKHKSGEMIFGAADFQAALGNTGESVGEFTRRALLLEFYNEKANPLAIYIQGRKKKPYKLEKWRAAGFEEKQTVVNEWLRSAAISIMKVHTFGLTRQSLERAELLFSWMEYYNYDALSEADIAKLRDHIKTLKNSLT